MTGIVAQTSPMPPMAGSPGWILVLTSMLMLASLAAGLWLFVRLRRGPAGSEPVCGSCGYMVRGLTTFACPECGADLRDVGIVKGGAGEPGAPGTSAAPLIVWVALCAAGGLFMLSVLQYKGAPNGNVGQWLAIVFLLTLAVAGGGGWLIDRWTRRAAAPAFNAGASPRQPAAPAPPAQGAAPPTTLSRTLSVMFIDMAGYTERSANSSRDGLIDLIRRTREMVEPAARARRGRLVKTMGDGFVVTFESATDAVLAGRDIQRKLAESNVSSDESGKPIDLRIGISTGEVALEQEDVYGEPVNLAARIQQRGTPGEVHFSEATWHAMTRTEVPHEAVGEFELKGISGTIKVFRAL